MRVPLAYIKGLDFRIFWFIGFKCLAIGEKTTTDNWTVLRGLAVTIEKIKFVGFGWRR